MKPFKSLIPVANFLLILAVAVIVYGRYFHHAITFSFNNLSYIIALLYVVFAVTLLIGKFSSNNALTILSGVGILVLSIVLMFMGGFSIQSLLNHFVMAALGFYFMARGNWG